MSDTAVFSESIASLVPGSTIGLVAGNGHFPYAFAESVKQHGFRLVVALIQGEADEGIAQMAHAVVKLRVGQFSKLFAFLRSNQVRYVAFLGGVRRARLFIDIKPDWIGLKILANARSVRDDELLRAIAKETERSCNASIISPALFLDKLLAKRGVVTKRSLSDYEKDQAALAWSIAKQLGACDVGQGVVACQGTVLALEAIEGTDAMIARAGELGAIDGAKRGQGGVLVKTVKPTQDIRLDLPAVGCSTLKVLSENGCTALVLEDQRAFILNPEEFRREADRLGIAVEVR